MAELLLLFAVKPALTTRLWWGLVKAAVLVRHGAESGEGEHSWQWRLTHASRHPHCLMPDGATGNRRDQKEFLLFQKRIKLSRINLGAICFY